MANGPAIVEKNGGRGRSRFKKKMGTKQGGNRVIRVARARNRKW